MEQVLTSLYHISPSASCVASLYSLRDFHLFFIVTTNPIYSALCKFEPDGSRIDKFELDRSRIGKFELDGSKIPCLKRAREKTYFYRWLQIIECN